MLLVDWSAADERFLDNRARFKNDRELVELLDAEWIRHTIAEWAPIFDERGVIGGQFQTSTGAHSDSQFEALGAVLSYHDPRVDRLVRTVDSPAHFTSLPRTISTDAPSLSEHTDEVLSDLGLAD